MKNPPLPMTILTTQEKAGFCSAIQNTKLLTNQVLMGPREEACQEKANNVARVVNESKFLQERPRGSIGILLQRTGSSSYHSPDVTNGESLISQEPQLQKQI
uniref:Uncharacterized protein n=1 Tax=Sphaerodactylus townsendi TaxID=933632 RepID=A0ACB8FQZ9_9SAUR